MYKRKPLFYLDSLFLIVYFMMLSWTAFNEWLPKREIITYLQFYFLIKFFIYVFIKKERVVFSYSSSIISLFCVLSIFWSNSLSDSKYYVNQLVIQTLLFIYFANEYDIRRLLQLIFYSGSIMAILSLIVSKVFPTYGIDQLIHYGAWEGIFTQKNNLAEVMLFYLIFNYYYLCYKDIKKGKLHVFIIILMIFLQVLLIFLSQSTTALFLLTVFILFVLSTYAFSKIKNKLLRISILSFLTPFLLYVILAFITNVKWILGLFGKDLTFTGRDVIWEASFKLMENKWLLGYGYRAIGDGTYFHSNLTNYINFEIYSLHDGFLETLVYIGIIGFSIVLFGLSLFLVKSFRSINGSQFSFLSLGFLCYLLILNLQESAFIGSEFALVWGIFVYLQTSIKLNKDYLHGK
ncbi:O-antigen ligase family protein [Gottfriedia sp. S16(2024)]|uniref:O-antigen ligase family protein n=1 Tax=Gottfriedia sp. S16(2024) TaxID=3162883 RepID=UPI003D1FFCFF